MAHPKSAPRGAGTRSHHPPPDRLRPWNSIPVPPDQHLQVTAPKRFRSQRCWGPLSRWHSSAISLASLFSSQLLISSLLNADTLPHLVLLLSSSAFPQARLFPGVLKRLGKPQQQGRAPACQEQGAYLGGGRSCAHGWVLVPHPQACIVAQSVDRVNAGPPPAGGPRHLKHQHPAVPPRPTCHGVPLGSPPFFPLSTSLRSPPARSTHHFWSSIVLEYH